MFRVFIAALVSCGLLAAPAHAQTVKVSGDNSAVTVLPSVQKKLKAKKVSLTAIRSATRKGRTVTFPLTRGRWDFADRDGFLNHFRGDTGMRFKAKGGRSVRIIDPRIVITDGASGYITANITNERFKVFRFKLKGAKVTDTATSQTLSNIKLITTKAAATRINRGVRRNVLRSYKRIGTLRVTVRRPASSPTAPGPAQPGTQPGAQPGQNAPGGQVIVDPGATGSLPPGSSVLPIGPGASGDIDGDGQPDAGAALLPLESAEVDVATRTGTIRLQGGLLLDVPGVTQVRLENPEIRLGTDEGLYATVNGVRVRVGDLDTDNLQFSVADGLVTITGLDARVSTVGAAALNGLLGLNTFGAGAELLHLRLVVPQT